MFLSPDTYNDPCSVYLDNTVLIDLSDSTQQRNSDAIALLELFQRHQSCGLLRFVISLWTITECQSKLYEQELVKAGTTLQRRNGKQKKLRDTIPPNRAALNAATDRVTELLVTLQSTTYDLLVLPNSTGTASDMMDLTARVAREAGIWPADSVHIALALDSGCSVLVSDDLDMLDKIDCCQKDFIQPYRRRQFSELPVPPPFSAHALQQTTSDAPGMAGAVRASAAAALAALGFV